MPGPYLPAGGKDAMVMPAPVKYSVMDGAAGRRVGGLTAGVLAPEPGLLGDVSTEALVPAHQFEFEFVTPRHP